MSAAVTTAEFQMTSAGVPSVAFFQDGSFMIWNAKADKCSPRGKHQSCSVAAAAFAVSDTGLWEVAMTYGGCTYRNNSLALQIINTLFSGPQITCLCIPTKFLEVSALVGNVCHPALPKVPTTSEFGPSQWQDVSGSGKLN